MKYRKRPVEVEAVRYPRLEHGDNADATVPEVPEWLSEAYDKGTVHPRYHHIDDDLGGCWELLIHTPEGIMIVSPGDWIIKGVANELYPCKSDIFALTYEEVT